MVEQFGAALPSERDGKQRRRVPAPRTWIYRNLTPWRIYARYGDDDTPPLDGSSLSEVDNSNVRRVLSIPALGEVRLANEDAEHLDTVGLRRRGQLDVRPAPSEFWSALPSLIVSLGLLAVVLSFGAWALLFGGWGAVPWEWFVASLVAVLVAALVVATCREIHTYRRFGRFKKQFCEQASCSKARSLEGVGRGSRFCTFVDSLPRQALEVAVLIGAVAIAVGGLGVAIHQTTQLNEHLPTSYRALLGFDAPFAGLSDLASGSPAFSQLVVGHVAQWILVSIAALTPAAMYFQFDRQRLAAVQRCWVQEVFRLDPTVRTVGDIEAKYGSQIEASFGTLAPDSSLRLRGGRRSPVIVATILLVVGWFLIISTTRVPPLVERGDELTWPGGSFPVTAFFRPDLSLVGYAFLGAYVFTLFHVIRGYQRRDLHPKSYNTVVVRILGAYVMALVVSVVWDGPGAEVMMFFVGFMPQSALVWLREKLSQQHALWGAVPLEELAPLTELEGIDLYDRTRLAEEGVNNIEALAHADIVDLMSSTRIAAAALVDWADQAILYLRVGGDAAARTKDESKNPSNDAGTPAVRPPDARQNLFHLRRYGIRTATDLLQAYDQAIRRGGGDRGKAQAEVEALRTALELPSTPEHAPISPIQMIIDTLPDEEWFTQIRNWRSSEFGAADSWYWYLDGVGMSPLRAPLPERVKRSKRPFDAYSMAVSHAPGEQPSAEPRPDPFANGQPQDEGHDNGDHERETASTQQSEDHSHDHSAIDVPDAAPAGLDGDTGDELRTLAHHGPDRGATVGE